MHSYIKDLAFVIREGSMNNTYKMAWIRSIVESCVLHPGQSEIHLDQLSPLIFRYYWDQSIFFDLVQGPNPNKRPEIQQMVEEQIGKYQSRYGFKPERHLKVGKRVSCEVEKVSSILMKDVSFRFPRVNGKTYDFYRLDRDRRTIWVHHPDQLVEYSDVLFDLINYSWAQKLEMMNSSPRISQKVRGTDRGGISRRSLSKFRKYLDLENPKRVSFISGEMIPEEELSIDHVIPWSYLYSDDIWNLVYVGKSENSVKNNTLPNDDDIAKLELRNIELMAMCDKHEFNDNHTEQLRLAIETQVVKRNWVGFKG